MPLGGSRLIQNEAPGRRSDWSELVWRGHLKAPESAASPRRSVFAPPADTLTRPGARKWRPANQAFPNLLFGGSLQY